MHICPNYKDNHNKFIPINCIDSPNRTAVKEAFEN